MYQVHCSNLVTEDVSDTGSHIWQPALILVYLRKALAQLGGAKFSFRLLLILPHICKYRALKDNNIVRQPSKDRGSSALSIALCEH